MYYISCKVGSKYGIIDTEDGKTEFYTPAQISNFVNKGINVIMRMLFHQIRVGDFLK